MFASSHKLRITPMNSSNDTIHRTEINTIKYTLSTILDDNDEMEENFWKNIQSFFNPQNSLIILAIICLIFFLIILCLVFLILQLLKKKCSYQNQHGSIPTNCSKLDHHHHHRKFPLSSPFQMGLTSNQIASSLGNIIPTNKEMKTQESTAKSIVSPSTIESTKTQSFDTFENELKRTWHDKGLPSSSINDDEIETVNEVLGMEERNGKVYYKVNFTGHPSDYTAWVCEEDLIPE